MKLGSKQNYYCTSVCKCQCYVTKSKKTKNAYTRLVRNKLRIVDLKVYYKKGYLHLVELFSTCPFFLNSIFAIK